MSPPSNTNTPNGFMSNRNRYNKVINIKKNSFGELNGEKIVRATSQGLATLLEAQSQNLPQPNSEQITSKEYADIGQEVMSKIQLENLAIDPITKTEQEQLDLDFNSDEHELCIEDESARLALKQQKRREKRRRLRAKKSRVKKLLQTKASLGITLSESKLKRRSNFQPRLTKPNRRKTYSPIMSREIAKVAEMFTNIKVDEHFCLSLPALNILVKEESSCEDKVRSSDQNEHKSHSVVTEMLSPETASLRSLIEGDHSGDYFASGSRTISDAESYIPTTSSSEFMPGNRILLDNTTSEYENLLVSASKRKKGKSVLKRVARRVKSFHHFSKRVHSPSQKKQHSVRMFRRTAE